MTARSVNRPGFPFPGTAYDVVGLAASAGGIDALGRVLAALPADFPAAVLVVQHLSPRHASLLPQILARRTALRVKPAEAGDRLAPGTVYVALPDWHVLVNPDGALALTHSGRVHHVRPSADVLFRSLAAGAPGRSVAVVLTGGDDDGADGVRAVHAVAGLAIAHEDATASCPGMPRAVAATGCVDLALPLDEIGPALSDWSAAGTGLLPSSSESDREGENLTRRAAGLA